jgi:hypothetical protein
MNFEMPYIEYVSKGYYKVKNAVPDRIINAAIEDLNYTTFDVSGVMTGIDTNHGMVYSMIECLLKQKLNDITGHSNYVLLSVDYVNGGTEHGTLRRDSDIYQGASDIVIIPLTVKGAVLKYSLFSGMRGDTGVDIGLRTVTMEPGDAIFHTAKTLVKVEAILKEFSYSFIKVVLKHGSG